MCNRADITPKDAADTMRRFADAGRVEWLAEPKLWQGAKPISTLEEHCQIMATMLNDNITLTDDIL